MPYATVLKILPGQTRTFTFSYEDELPAGVGFEASGHTVVAVNHYSGVEAPDILGSDEPTISGTDVSFVCTGVGVGERYDITLTLTLDDATPTVFPEKVLLIGVEILD